MKNIEEQHQIALISWAKSARIGNIKIGDYLLSIPNGLRVSKRQAGRAKASGLKAGVSDLFLALPAQGFGGLWVEMKKPVTPGSRAGTLQDSQIEWLNRMEDAGYAVAVCYGWESAVSVIKAYLTPDKEAV